MRIAEQTRTRLRLRHCSLYTIVGRSLVLSGFATLVAVSSLIVKSSQVICYREADRQINCQIDQFSLLKHLSRNSVNDVLGADVIESSPKGYPIYEVILKTKYGEFSLLSHRGGNYEDSQKVIRQINDFVRRSEFSRLELSYSGYDYVVPLEIFIIAVVVIGIFFASSGTTICILDRELDKITIKHQKNFIYQIDERKLSEVSRLEIEENQNPSKNIVAIKMRYRAILVLEKNKKMFLTKFYDLTSEDIFLLRAANKFLCANE